LREASANQGVLVLEDDGSIVGFCHFSPTRDDEAGPATGEVTAIYLLASHWGRGGGSRLLAEAVQVLTEAGFQRATLWVLDGNERARRFYEKHGWHADGSIKLDERGTFHLRELRYGRPL
jgi:GNAT superfamily N-acetyltransferase